MKKEISNTQITQELSLLELKNINGGYAEYDEGYAAGLYVRKIIDGVFFLASFI